MKGILAVSGPLGLAIALHAGTALAAEARVDVGTEDRVILLVARMTPSDPPPGFCDPCRSECPVLPSPAPAPSAEEPSELDTICITSAGYTWFVAEVRQVLVGGPLPDRIHVQMWRHRDGTRMPDGDSTLWLVNASPGGTFLTTGDNGRDALDISRWGEPYLLLREKWLDESGVRAPGSLPCSVNELREEVAAADFPGAWRPKAELYPFEKDDIAAGRAEYLHVDARGASPRYGIALMRLRAHLASLGELHDDDFRCYPDDWARYQGKPVAPDPDE
jgi:hypothetical protein